MNSTQNNGFDLGIIVSRSLAYFRHVRLMVATGCIGVLAGMVFYVYTIPLYEARGLVYLRAHGSPVSVADVPETMESRTISRSFIQEFTSKRNLLETAKRMKIVGPNGTWADVLDAVPAVTVSELDSSHIEVAVQARSPEVLHSFISAMVDEFREQQQTSWRQYRDDALQRYADELKALDAKGREGMKQLSALEREGKMAETSLRQTRLNELPKDLIISRELVQKMGEIQKRIDSTPEIGEASADLLPLPKVIEELSLLTTFEKERDVKIGDVVRRPTATGGSPLISAGGPKMSAEVVVQPGMVDPLQPWQKLEKDRRILEGSLLELGKQYLPEHALMKKVNEDLESNERALRAELSFSRQRFQLEHEHYRRKLATLEAQLPDYHNVNERLSLDNQAYSDLEKQNTLWDKAREHLAEKLAVITFAEQRDWLEIAFQGHVSLRDKIPISPNKSKLALLSFFLALGLSIGTATVVNILDASASTLPQLEAVTGLKGVGIVPHTTAELLEDICRSPAIGSKVPNFLLENFRLMRSHILLNPASSSRRNQVVMVTSARASEGKTSIACNLAWAFQSIGGRTLLIDCDLRRGRVHHFTKLPNEIGLTPLLLGKCTLQEAIEKTPLPLLDVIPRGHIIIGTTDLLVQAIFHDLITKLRGEYDHIILDTPPVLGLSETTSLQKVVDGVLMVVRAEKTPRKDVLDAVTLLRKAGAYFYGLVLNDLDLNKTANYYNYYYYSSTYYDDLEAPADEAALPEAS